MGIYEERIGKVRSTSLGREDHGIFTAMLHIDFGGSGQGVGGYPLDAPIDDGERSRIGTAAGMDWIVQVCRVFGDCEWEKIAGRTCLVLYPKNSGWSELPVGLAPLPTERGEPFVFQDWKNDFFPESS